MLDVLIIVINTNIFYRPIIVRGKLNITKSLNILIKTFNNLKIDKSREKQYRK